jgi:hypothetical protein
MTPTIMDVAALLMMSPTKTCKVRVSSTRYRNDPYRARVNPLLKVGSPVFLGRLNKISRTASDESIEVIPAAAVVAPVAAVPALVAPKPVKSFAAATAVAAAKAAPAPAAIPTAAKNVEAPNAAPKQHYALIGFKHEASMYQAPFRVAVGDVVIVEADRGEHIGVVQSITTTQPGYNVPSRLVRHASQAEMALVDDLTMKEKKVTAGIQKLAESLGLGIRVVDTEFQMDNNKLTVFFSSKVFVDFRKLQRSLFREYRCRIWLVNWAEVRPYTPVPVNAIA